MIDKPEAEYVEYDFSPYTLPGDMLIAIGLVTTAAAQTEDMIQLAIAGCLGIDSEYGKATTLHMAMPLRISVLKSSAEIKIDDLDVLDQLDELIDEIERAFERRNAIVHHQWCTDIKTKQVFTSKEVARSSLRADLIPMTVAQVKEDALLIYTVGLKLFAFIQKHGLLPNHPPVRPRFHKTKPERKKRREALLKSQ